jgi:formylglycine-generating enzyme required for sulfatase activity
LAVLTALSALTLAIAQQAKEAGIARPAARGEELAGVPQLAVAPFDAEATRKHQEAWVKHLGQPREITNSIGMKLVRIPPGEFKMGSGESAEATAAFFNKTYGEDLLSAGFFKGEHPQHRVRITKPFYLGTYHVTRGQFRQFVKDSGYKTEAEKAHNPGAWGWDPDKKEFSFNEKYSWRNTGFDQTDEHPVVNVSWNDAVAFCKWLSKKENKTYRLPTEAEWEYACRAGTTTRYYSGDDPETLAKVANVADAAFKAKYPGEKYTIKASDGYVFASPVGSFKPNAFGLYDMHGNAWQWCSDWYGAEYYATSLSRARRAAWISVLVSVFLRLNAPVRCASLIVSDLIPCRADDPAGPDSGNRRVFRGGAWGDRPDVCRSAARGGGTPGNRNYSTGFRVASTP